MPDSQNPEHVRKLIQEFQLKGQNLIPTVTGEIVPTIQVADLSTSTSVQDRPAVQGTIGAASGAGNQNRLGLGNPAGSQISLLVDSVTVWQQLADVFHIQIGGYTGGPVGLWRDGLLAGDAVAGTFRVAATAVVLDAIQYPILALTALTVQLNWKVAAGTSIWVQQQNQNETLHAVWMWRERDLLPGE